MPQGKSNLVKHLVQFGLLLLGKLGKSLPAFGNILKRNDLTKVQYVVSI